jgi:hypothetical protein
MLGDSLYGSDDNAGAAKALGVKAVAPAKAWAKTSVGIVIATVRLPADVSIDLSSSAGGGTVAILNYLDNYKVMSMGRRAGPAHYQVPSRPGGQGYW